MSTPHILYLEERVDADFEGFNHLTYFRPSLHAIASVGRYVADLAGQASASAAAAAANYANQLALGAGAYGIGNLPLHLPRAGALGSAAFLNVNQLRGIFPGTQNAAYQIVPHDFGKLLLTTTGTNTWTLPLAADLDEGWFALYRNRSGNNLTIQRSGADGINNAASSVTISTGAAIGWIIRTGSTTFEVG